MDWVPYKSCCFEAAGSLDSDVGFCPKCGHALMRCIGFADCGKLVTPGQACPGCMAPQLIIDAGAAVSAKAGDRMSVPLILLNQSPAGRPLWVKRISKLDGTAEQHLSIPWEQVDAHGERRFSLDTALAEGGTYTLHVRLVLAARYKNVEEEYAFAAGIAVSAAAQEHGVKHNLNFVTVSGDVSGAGAIGHNVRFTGDGGLSVGGNVSGAGAIGHEVGPSDKRATTATALVDKKPVPLERAERYELEQGIRGYRKEGVRVLRNVDLAFSGFRPEDIPREPPALIASGRLLFGRNSRPPVPENVTANDVCLRAFDPKAKKVDEPATMAISRHHFDFVVVNDRLAVQVRAPGGMQVNEKTLTAGEVYPIAPGDRIIPIPGRADKLTLRVAFSNGIGVVNRVDVSRTPPIPKNA
jgi:hypothetical protein